LNQDDIDELFIQLELGLEWYNNFSTKAKLPKLLEWQDQMAIRSYYIAEMLANAKGDYNSKYFMRKIAVAKKQVNLIKAGTAIGQAQPEALIEAEKELEAEQKSEAVAVKFDILLKQVNKVLQASQQRISYEKEEYNRTKYGQTST